MLKIAAITLVSIPVLLVGLLLSSSCVIVDVQTADLPHLIVPVPLFAARAALSFAPEEARHLEVPELAEYLPVARDILAELRDLPDALLVEVDDGDEHVVIEKIDDELSIEVHGPDEDVSVSLPFEVIAEVFASYDGETLDTKAVLQALSSASSGKLVHVRDGEEEVKIWIW